MRVIIAGAGQVGRGIASALRGEKRSVAIIDPNPEAIRASQSLDCLLVTGSALSRDSLLRAGISDAEIIVLATNNDELNLLACSFANKVYSEQVGDRNASGLIAIARIRNTSLVDEIKGAGPLEKWSRADHAVCASEEIVEHLVSGLLAPSLNDIIPLGNNTWISISEVKPNSSLIGSTTSEPSQTKDDLSEFIPPIYAIKSKGEKDILSTGSEIIREGDNLVFVTNSTSKFSLITRALGELDSELPEFPTVAIFGATHFGSKIAQHYLSKGSNVVIIEPDLDTANEIVGSEIGINKRLDVIHGDPQDEELLRELAIDEQDIAIATLDDDNLNISISMRAKDKGVPRTGLLLKDRALVEAVKRIGLTRPISSRQVAISAILKSIHKNYPGSYQNIPSLPSIVSLSTKIHDDHVFLNSSISEAERKIDVRVVMVDRTDTEGNREVRYPISINNIEKGDRIYLLTQKDNLRKVEKALGN
jgi:trk system potassium uptake protein TrkA